MDLIKPVYLRDREIQCGSTRISDFDLSMSVTKSISDLTCVQKDRDLWRIYVKSKESRSKILTEGIDIRNTNVKVYDTNPYSAGLNDPSDNVIKITVKGVPLSVDDNEVLNMLKNFNVSFTSDIKYEKIRHPVTRKMTSILNGNRFIYVKALDEGVFLPRTSTCAGLRCSIYHHGQPSTKHNPHCTNCWEDTHFTRDCPNNKRCKVCKHEGHLPGDESCEFHVESENNVLPFAGRDNCLSNFYPCELNVFGISHKSAEHAFQYIKAMRSGDIPRATSIQSAATALDAKKIGKLIIPSPSFTEKQIAIMTEILEAKADQIPEFSDLLKKHKKSVFVETTYDDFWASGLDKEATIHTRASAWPGTNKLGIIMSEIAGRLRRSAGRSHSASGPKTRTASKDKSKTQQLQISEMIQDIRKTQNSGGSVTKKTATTSQVRDSHARTAEG